MTVMYVVKAHAIHSLFDDVHLPLKQRKAIYFIE